MKTGTDRLNPGPWLTAVLLGLMSLAATAETVDSMSSAGCAAFEDERGWFVSHKEPRPLPAESFEDENGQQYHLSDLAGKPLLVHFWGTWCPPCLKELPSINRLQGLLWNEGLLVVPLSRDSGGPDQVRKTYDKLDIGFLPIFTDRIGKLAYHAGISSVPITLYVNREGQEIGRLYGSVEWTSEAMKNHVRACLLSGSAQITYLQRFSSGRAGNSR